MEHMDAEFVVQAIQRLRQIGDDTPPRWGSLTKQAMVEHLVWAVRMSMGRTEKPVPFVGNWFSVHVLRRISLSGILPIPKNLKMPKALQDQGITGREPGDVETLQSLLNDYLHLVHADEFTPPPHPVLGEMTIDDWATLHVIHIEHHLKQFGV